MLRVGDVLAIAPGPAARLALDGDPAHRGGVQTLEQPEIIERTLLDTPWVTIVWNDPVNLMSYVSHVFRSYFGFTEQEADRRMLLVHNEGRAVVATGNREEMERHVEAMHDYGLWATLQKSEQ
ncbi:ATP-dependent Clp protease adapter ClpS [Naasia lichenicola]|uniref:ATP-dependent Clp protease adapter protein ClpS n=1 Tax=Naasia lichenicola TaxID=2565933 RepID=A0A4S4FU77_9MICO|nr:ATP-dependent Clp protease adapter ClpS [Naasia lichenicola]